MSIPRYLFYLLSVFLEYTSVWILFLAAKWELHVHFGYIAWRTATVGASLFAFSQHLSTSSLVVSLQMWNYHMEGFRVELLGLGFFCGVIDKISLCLPYCRILKVEDFGFCFFIYLRIVISPKSDNGDFFIHNHFLFWLLHVLINCICISKPRTIRAAKNLLIYNQT